MNEKNKIVKLLTFRTLKQIKTEESFLQSLYSQLQKATSFQSTEEMLQECANKREELVELFNHKYTIARRSIDQHHGIVGMYVVAQLEFENFIFRVPGTEIYMKTIELDLPVGNWRCNAGTLPPKGYSLLPMLEAEMLLKNFEKGSDHNNQNENEEIEELDSNEEIESLSKEELRRPLNYIELIDRIELSETETILFHIKKYGYISMPEIFLLDKNGSYVNGINYLERNNKIIKLTGLDCYIRFIHQPNTIRGNLQLTHFDITFETYKYSNQQEEELLTTFMLVLFNTPPMIMHTIDEMKYLTSINRDEDDGYYL